MDASGSLMCDAGNTEPVFCENTEGWDGEGGKEGVQGGEDMCIPRADSCWCMAKTTTILLSNYPLTEKFKN